MAGIAEAMSRMTGGGKRGGISGAMEGHRELEREPEEKEGGVPEHMKAMHEEMGGKHMHVHQGEQEEGYTTHHVGEDGKVEGPHDHQNMEELKSHMGKFFDEEEHEHEPSGDHDDSGLM